MKIFNSVLSAVIVSVLGLSAMCMKRYIALTAAAALSLTGLAHAGTLVSPGLPTLHSTTFEGGTLIETGGACYVRNIGVNPISLQVTMPENFNPGFLIAPSFENCNAAPLPAGRTCVFIVDNLPDDVTCACSVTSDATTAFLKRESAWNPGATRRHHDKRF